MLPFDIAPQSTLADVGVKGVGPVDTREHLESDKNDQATILECCESEVIWLVEHGRILAVDTWRSKRQSSNINLALGHHHILAGNHLSPDKTQTVLGVDFFLLDS